ncbi:hypothetical protein BLOT_014899 [Blomia tropicalis]|nr:hypothetical protein BLOT_014899 [Blomia tropicalis]
MLNSTICVGFEYSLNNSILVCDGGIMWMGNELPLHCHLVPQLNGQRRNVFLSLYRVVRSFTTTFRVNVSLSIRSRNRFRLICADPRARANVPRRRNELQTIARKLDDMNP